MYNSNEISKILPHKFPFLLIDRIIEMEEGKYAKGIKNITVTDPVFQGHFPDEHVYPGVLIVEAMAQVGAFAILSEEKNIGKKAYFTKIKEVKFLKTVVPGDTLEITTTLISRRLNVGFANCIACVNGEVVCRGEIAFALSL
ncbi:MULTISPECIES: 3-hydroxyacyl-ACP dehydratase FabZ [Peptoniphilus]|uniref:3-hydroxyacyl-ACP dehydratase FabZ n=1 Tax=Peptoniphilus TaxID=162289 RepID=UPI0001DA9CFA|nr:MULTISPECIES: 3-hydroxyacyl-ACP dehydratase FabZ [Peptoniphilus]EFI42466.1 (3R)-hydroxymyristoyl-ACP dehydratase [Peptoniphilus sp. oral taxon 386 str. F0131]